MPPNPPKLTFSCSTLPTCSLDEFDMVEDTYLTPTQLQPAWPNVEHPAYPGYGEGGGEPSSQLSYQGLVGNESYSFSDFVRYTSGQSQKERPCTTFAPDTTTLDTELGLARGGDADTMLPQNAVQEVTHKYRANYPARAPTDKSQYSNCPSTSCLCLCVDGTLCLQEISCATVPSHFVSHGVKKKSRKEAIRCMWKGCVKTVARHTFARHIREVHLGHARATGPQLGE